MSSVPPNNRGWQTVLLISTLLPLLVFLVFQRFFLRPGDIGGSIKG
jgi:hypothetical protein